MIGELTKLLLVLPSNTYRAQRFLEAATRLGIELVIATDSDFSPPGRLATVFDNISFCDAKAAGEQLAQLASTHKIESALAVDEAGIEVAAWTNAFLKNRVVNLEGLLATRQKTTLRKILTSAGVPQPRFIECSAATGALKSRSWSGFPVVVKPTKGSGSLGVTLAKDRRSLEKGLGIASNVMKEMGYLDHLSLVEEYIDGPEYAVEVLVIESKATVLAIFEKPDPLVGPAFAETIYLTPPRITKLRRDSIVECASQVAVALSITNGPMHIEVRITADGICVPIDVASRSIGGRCSDALSFAFSATLEELILRNAASIEIRSTARERQASGVFMIPVQSEGVLRNIRGVKNALAVRFIQGVEITIPNGTPLRPLPYDNQYLGFIFAKGPGPAGVEAALRQAHSLLNIEIERLPNSNT